MRYKEKNGRYMECRELVLKFFNNDYKKTELWFRTKNPLLGNIKPYDMWIQGRVVKLHNFIKSQLLENNRDK